jgi:hypothetical protein
MKTVTGLFLLIAAAAFGQNQSSAFSRGATGQFSGTVGFGAGRFAPPAVTGAPYAGEEIQEHQQTLSDGTHITQTQSQRMMYRDSEGRTRVERWAFPGLRGQESPMIIEITDLVTAVQYTLDTEHKIAHRVVLQPMPAVAGRGGVPTGVIGNLGGALSVPPPTVIASAAGAVSPQIVMRNGANGVPQPVNTEKLGTQMFDTVMAEGQRQTMTIPANSQGNDRDFHVITETWTSPDLRMTVYRRTSDPRSGDSITRFANLSRNEPDPQLFLPPPDYQVVDETGPFSIRYGQ